jgi:hypothetical protein
MLLSKFFIKVNNVIPVSKKKCGFVYEHVTNVLVHDKVYGSKFKIVVHFRKLKLTSDGGCEKE